MSLQVLLETVNKCRVVALSISVWIARHVTNLFLLLSAYSASTNFSVEFSMKFQILEYAG